jgi:hypothetical protein
MADPASVEVTVTVAGLAPSEAAAILSEVPSGARFVAAITQPAIGPRRYQCTVDGLSLVRGVDVLEALRLHFDRAAADAGASPLPDWERELLEGAATARARSCPTCHSPGQVILGPFDDQRCTDTWHEQPKEASS